MNVAGSLYGISQKVLPGKNFSRFLLMLFLMFCLIIRTAWQGKMFELMQKDMTKREIQSIEELIEKNFTFYMFDLFSYYFNNLNLFEK